MILKSGQGQKTENINLYFIGSKASSFFIEEYQSRLTLLLFSKNLQVYSSNLALKGVDYTGSENLRGGGEITGIRRISILPGIDFPGGGGGCRCLK